MKINIRDSAALLAAVAILAGVQVGPAQARGGASDLRYERAQTQHTRSATDANKWQTERQKAAIQDQATSDADSAGWFGLEWPDFDQGSQRPQQFPRHGIPHGR